MIKLLILIFTFIYLSLNPTSNVFATENGLGVCPQDRKLKKRQKNLTN